MLFNARLSFPRSSNGLAHSPHSPWINLAKEESRRARWKKKKYTCVTHEKRVFQPRISRNKERNAIVLITWKTARVRPNILPGGEPFCRQSRQEAANKARAAESSLSTFIPPPRKLLMRPWGALGARHDSSCRAVQAGPVFWFRSRVPDARPW